MELVKDPLVVYLAVIAIVTSAILAYIQGAFEEWKYDFCTMLTKVMQVLVSSSIKLRIRTNGTRLILLCEFWGSFLAFIVVATLYTTIIQQSIHEYQMHTRRELIKHNFRLAGNAHALNYLQKQQTVSKSLFFFGDIRTFLMTLFIFTASDSND